MRISDKMRDFTAFMAEIYSIERLDFSNTADLIDAENLLNQMKNFVNSADFLNEFSAICNRFQNGLRAEDLKRKGF